MSQRLDDELKEQIVEHLFDDEEFRTAAKKFVVENFMEDAALRTIFKERAGGVVNRLFGFRRVGNPAAVVSKTRSDGAKRAAKTKAKIKAKTQGAKVQGKSGTRSNGNKLTHKGAITAYLSKYGKPSTSALILEGVQKTGHSMNAPMLSSILMKMKESKKLQHTMLGMLESQQGNLKKNEK